MYQNVCKLMIYALLNGSNVRSAATSVRARTPRDGRPANGEGSEEANSKGVKLALAKHNELFTFSLMSAAPARTPLRKQFASSFLEKLSCGQFVDWESIRQCFGIWRIAAEASV